MAGEIQRSSSPLPPAANAKDAAFLELVQELTTSARKVQEEVLAEILSANKDTEYLGSFDLRGATDPASFKAKVPVIEYEQIRPYVRKIAQGDRSALLVVEPISEFLTSSGTSGGERKLIPATKRHSDRRPEVFGITQALLNSCIPDLDKGKVLPFLFASSETRTPAGHPVHQTTTSIFKSDHFCRIAHQIYTSPLEAILCLDYSQSMYVHMLCGLYHREVVRSVEAIFASGLLRAIRFLQLHYQELANDISTGSLSPTITDASLRAAVSHLLEPNPALGEVVLRECSTGNWEGIVRRIWPAAKYMGTVVTGSMAKYIPDLEHLGGGLPLVSIAYSSSECHIGLNLRPKCKPSDVWYTIMPNMAYFEFIPVEGGDGLGKPVDFSEVEVGKEYELVVTTYTGLYRYRLGDVLRVMGFHNAAPQVQVLRRKNVILSIESDMTDEVELQRGVDSASRLLREFGTSIVDYTSYADTKTIPGHYVIYLEMFPQNQSRRPSGEVMEKCCMAIEEQLNAMYRQSRAEHGSIGALEIRVVREGTFDELMALAVSKGTSASQYKMPRCISSVADMELLHSRVASSYFSRGLPTWSPSAKHQ